MVLLDNMPFRAVIRKPDTHLNSRVPRYLVDMKNWFTVHSPHGDRDLAWHIYLQDQYALTASDIHEGDRVFFYETKTNRNVKHKQFVGRMGLVHVGHVNGAPYRRGTEEAHAIYTGGERKYWSTGITTDAGESRGFVSREKVVKILGYKDNYYFKGYARGVGIKMIEMGQAQKLLQLFQGHR